MSRSCTTCQHLKRPEIDRRLAAGEPAAQVAHDYGLNASSLHRHRVNCLNLGPSSTIKKDAARGSAAVALLPSKETLSDGYWGVCAQIDQIVAQAREEGSLKIALDGLNSIRRTFDSLSRLAGHDRAGSTEINVAVQTNVQLDLTQITEQLIQQFDHEPEIKARLATALVTMDQRASGQQRSGIAKPAQMIDVEPTSLAPQAPTTSPQQTATTAADTQKTAPAPPRADHREEGERS